MLNAENGKGELTVVVVVIVPKAHHMEFRQRFAFMKDCSYIREKQIVSIEKIAITLAVIIASSDSLKLRGLVFALYFML